MCIGIDVQLSAPLDHALENGNKTFEPFDANGLLLDGRRAQFHHLAALGDLGQDVHQSLEDVGRRQITVVVDVEIDHALSVGADTRQGLHDQPVMVQSRSGILQNIQKDFPEKYLRIIFLSFLKSIMWFKEQISLFLENESKFLFSLFFSASEIQKKKSSKNQKIDIIMIKRARKIMF